MLLHTPRRITSGVSPACRPSTLPSVYMTNFLHGCLRGWPQELPTDSGFGIQTTFLDHALMHLLLHQHGVGHTRIAANHLTV
jgi:hypothetical protein